MSGPFAPVDPNGGISPNLIPNPPGAVPEAPGAGDATARLSPFLEAQDVDAIVAQLTLDRPLTLWIPDKHKYPDWEFRVINSIPREVAHAHNNGFREITDPELTRLFVDLVAGTGKDGKAFRPLLFARPKKVGEVVRKRQREQLRSLYAGMDPKHKDLASQSKYASNVDAKDGTFLQREGAPWRIRV